MKRYILGIMLLSSVCSCSREFSAMTKPVADSVAFVPEPMIPLDHNYNLYYRAVAVEEIDQGGQQEERLAPYDAIKSPKLVEIEYLFVPAGPGKVIYISTIADRYEDRYSSAGFLGLNHPNAADFRVFLIGNKRSTDPNQFYFEFKNGKEHDIWTVNAGPDQIKLLRIEQKRGDEFEDIFEIKDALAHPAEFIRAKDWTLRYLPKDEKNATLAQALSGGGITYTKKGDKKYTLHMRFGQTELSWQNKYVIYKPD